MAWDDRFGGASAAGLRMTGNNSVTTRQHALERFQDRAGVVGAWTAGCQYRAGPHLFDVDRGHLAGEQRAHQCGLAGRTVIEDANGSAVWTRCLVLTKVDDEVRRVLRAGVRQHEPLDVDHISQPRARDVPGHSFQFQQQPDRPRERLGRSPVHHGDANPAFGEPSRQFRMHKTQAR